MHGHLNVKSLYADIGVYMYLCMYKWMDIYMVVDITQIFIVQILVLMAVTSLQSGDQSSIRIHGVTCTAIFNIFPCSRIMLYASNILLDLCLSAIRVCLHVCSAAGLIQRHAELDGNTFHTTPNIDIVWAELNIDTSVFENRSIHLTGTSDPLSALVLSHKFKFFI